MAKRKKQINAELYPDNPCPSDRMPRVSALDNLTDDPGDAALTKDEIEDLENQLRSMVRFHRSWDGGITMAKVECMALINAAKRPGITPRERKLIESLNPVVLGQDLVDTIHFVVGLKGLK